MEAYFQEHVATAEGLAAQGPEQYVKAATHFYRALRVYPQPVELLMIYQKVCPEPVFQLVLKLTQLSSAANAGGAAAVQRVATGAGVTAVEEDGVDEDAPADKKEEAEEKEEEEKKEETDEEKEDTASHPSSGASWEKVNEDN
jgi:import receptor subunit TOM20